MMLNKLLGTCLSSAQAYVDIVTNAAIDEMEANGISFDLKSMNLVSIAKMAAKRLKVDPDETSKNYCKLMVLMEYAEEV